MWFAPWGITIRCPNADLCKFAQMLAKAFKKAGFPEPPTVEIPSKWNSVLLLIGRQPTADFGKQTAQKPIKKRAVTGSKKRILKSTP
jgi:hypothetical protein